MLSVREIPNELAGSFSRAHATAPPADAQRAFIPSSGYGQPYHWTAYVAGRAASFAESEVLLDEPRAEVHIHLHERLVADAMSACR